MSISTSFIDPPAKWNNQTVNQIKAYNPLLLKLPDAANIPFVSISDVDPIQTGTFGMSIARPGVGVNANIIFPLPGVNGNIVQYGAGPINGPVVYPIQLVSNQTLPLFTVPTLPNKAYNITLSGVSNNITDLTATSYKYDLGNAYQGLLGTSPLYNPPIAIQTVGDINTIVFSHIASPDLLTINVTGVLGKNINGSFSVLVQSV